MLQDIDVDVSEIEALLHKYDQSHLLHFFNQLKDQEKEILIHQLAAIDYEEARDSFKEAMEIIEREKSDKGKNIEPVPIEAFGSALTCGDKKIRQYWNDGLKAIAEGKVAALVLSGGQGTRLGMNVPKGMISIGLPSGKTIMQIHMERIRKLQVLSERIRKKKGSIPLYVMTSEATHEHLIEFLKVNENFGMDKEDVILFKQGMSPCFDFEGRIILSEKHLVAMAPDGTGGIFKAMDRTGVFQDMTKRGVHYVYVFPTDNVMVKVADPIFLGYCLETETDCAAKVVRKHAGTQNVGNVCKVDGVYSVVEYTEINDELAMQKDDKGELRFHSGSICIHVFELDFMRRMAGVNLTPHVAKKKVPFVDEAGVGRRPTVPNGIKIERFVFEAFKHCRRFVTWEVGYDEFSAIKNPDKERYECLKTAKTDLLAVHKRYVERLGGVAEDADVEVSPLVSYAGEDLAERVRGVVFPPFCSTHIQSREEYEKNRADDSFKSFSQMFQFNPTMIIDS